MTPQLATTTVKKRKVGNSEVFTIPAHMKSEAVEFTITHNADGSYIFKPKRKNPFDNPDLPDGYLRQFMDDDWLNEEPLASEWAEWPENTIYPTYNQEITAHVSAQ